MANRWCDGLARYGGTIAHMLNGSSSQAWAEMTAGFSLSTANPRTGTHSLRLGTSLNTEQIARRVFGAPLGEVYLGFAINCAALPSFEPDLGGGNFQTGVYLPILCDQANNPQITFILGTDGAIAVYLAELTETQDFNGTLLGRTIPIIGAGAYQHIEIYAKAGNGDGAVEIRVDEVTRLNLTGIDTVQTANVEFSQAKWGKFELEYLPGAIDFADFYCNDTTADGSGCDDFIGDCKSGVRMVNGDTAQADFDLSAGILGYDLLDDKPPNDATYISTEDATAQSDFEVEAGPASLTEILTVRPFVRAWKDDAGTAEIAPSMLSDAEKAVVTAQPIATAPSYYDSNVPLDPDTGSPWTPAALDAALEVIERTA
jgi:hypothetical protein